uniref:Uncharacterized protein n=3 Tax=Aegilops tauschii subsp. strangulata TaxID=200361 RepID=A0A453I041_AEGTS
SLALSSPLLDPAELLPANPSHSSRRPHSLQIPIQVPLVHHPLPPVTTPTSPPAHPWSSRHLSAPPTASTETVVDLRCASWRTAGEANNLAPWAAVPQDCVPHVHAYLTDPAYRSDLDLIAGRPPPTPAPPLPPAPGSSTSTRRCSTTSPTTRGTDTGWSRSITGSSTGGWRRGRRQRSPPASASTGRSATSASRPSCSPAAARPMRVERAAVDLLCTYASSPNPHTAFRFSQEVSRPFRYAITKAFCVAFVMTLFSVFAAVPVGGAAATFGRATAAAPKGNLHQTLPHNSASKTSLTRLTCRTTRLSSLRTSLS